MTPWTKVDQKYTKDLRVSSSLWLRTKGFMEAIFGMSGTTTIMLGTGTMSRDDWSVPCILFIINDVANAFSRNEAIELADTMEGIMSGYTDDRWLDVVSDVVMMLRLAVDTLDKEDRSETRN